MQNKDGKYCLTSKTHPKELVKNLCSLIEHQCMVDVAITCGNNTIQAHRCILSANSLFFKENLEDKNIEQVLINGMEFSVLKAFIEFMYCGEMIIPEEHMKYFFAGVKLFRMTSLTNIFNESQFKKIAAEEVVIPPPQFVTKPPKFPTVLKPSNNNYSRSLNKNHTITNAYQNKMKKKITSDAEKTCYKEAQDSKETVSQLRNSMKSQLQGFFLNEDLQPPMLENQYNYPVTDIEKYSIPLSNTALTKPSSSNSIDNEQLNYLLNSDNVKILYQINDGNLVNVSDDVIQNLTNGTIQYQLVDENGQISTIQEIETIESAEDTANIEIQSHQLKLQNPDISLDNDNIYLNAMEVNSSDFFGTNLLTLGTDIILEGGNINHDNTFNPDENNGFIQQVVLMDPNDEEMFSEQ